MECPDCHYSVPPGAFRCVECGHWFTSSAESTGGSDRGDAPAVSVAEVVPPDVGGTSRIVRLEPDSWGGGAFDVGVDTLVPFISGGYNSLRILFVSNSDSVEHAEITVSPQDGECVQPCRSFDVTTRECECLFGIRKLSDGMIPCDVCVNVVIGGIARRFAGSFILPVTTSKDANTLADRNISIHFQNSFNNTIESNVAPGGDSRVKIGDVPGQDVMNRLQGRQPLDEIGDLVKSGSRSYRRVEMLADGGFKPLPTVSAPPGAASAEIQLAFGSNHCRHIVQFFTDDEICIGHSVDGVRGADIIVDAPIGCDAGDSIVYDRISRRHCMLSRRGGEIEICDGGVRLNDSHRRVYAPSTNGTFLNGRGLGDPTPFADGELRLGTARDAVTLTLNAVHSVDCARCPIAAGNRIVCADGRCPCVMVSRNDGVDVHYVALWGCFDLGAIDRNFSGVEIFHHGVGFGWRRGVHAGWLEDGVDFGLSHYGGIAVSPVWAIPQKGTMNED